MKRLAIAVLVACGAPAVQKPAPPPVAIVDPSARTLLDAWATSIGGRAKVAALGALHLRGRYTKGGITGTIDLWETPHGERREEIQLAFLHELRVFDGSRGWLVDRNGEVRDLDGFELDDQLAFAFRGSFAPLLADRAPGAVTVDAKGNLVLAAAGGHRPETVTLGPDHRPARILRRDDRVLKVRRDLPQGNEAVALPVGRAVDQRLEAALNVHRGRRRIDPACGDEQKHGERPERDEAEKK